jgi:hypothetical protein
MTQRDNILQELNELQSSLTNAAVQNVYQVPAGYFDGLADQLVRRVKALETENASQELNHLSPFLSSISKEMLYAVPAGYFENFTETIYESVITSDQSISEELERISPFLSSLKKEMPYAVPAGYFENLDETIYESVIAGDQTAAEELERISPFLSSLKKEMPYSVPENFFEQLNTTTNTEAGKPAVKIVSITRKKWFRYAAAAVVIGFVAMTGFLLMNKNNSTGDAEPGTIVNKMMQKVSTEEIDSFVQMLDAGTPVIASNDTKEMNEVKELIKDIPDKEIQDFLDETQTSVAEDNSDDMLIN